MHEENQLSTASAMMFATAVNSQAPANTNLLVGENSPHRPFIARMGSTRPCPSPPNDPAPKRQITSWPGHVPNLTSSEPNQRLTAPTANFPLPQLPIWSYPLTAYGATNAHTGPLVDPINPAAWNVTALTNGATTHVSETLHRPLPPSGPSAYFLSSSHHNATPHHLSHYWPVGTPSESLSLRSLQDPSLNRPPPPPSTSPFSDAVASAPVNKPIYSSARFSPLPLISANFLPEHTLDLELMRSRSGMSWANWELQIILFKLLGPDAQVHFILTLLREPRRTANESELNPVWCQLSAMSFRGARTVAAVLARWGALVDTCKVILYFAEESGLNLYSPEFLDVEIFVNEVVAMWRRRVPEGKSWGMDLKLKPADVAAWTHDPKNGWFAMMYRRLRESNVPLPLMELSQPVPNSCPPSSSSQRLKGGRPTQSLSEGCSPLHSLSGVYAPVPQRRVSTAVSNSGIGPHPSSLRVLSPHHIRSASRQSNDPGLGHQAHPSQAAQSSIAPDDTAENNGPRPPVPEGYSRGWEMLRNQHVLSSASTSVANAKAKWINSQAIGNCAEMLDRLLERAENARERRLQLAYTFSQNAPATSAVLQHLDNWVYENYFTVRPLDELEGFITRVGLIPAANTEPDEVQAAPTPPEPLLTLPDHYTHIDGIHR
ncbi:unnamed protein product [Rhizoctonia solani]|uniref:Uncharacterized protein n=1 Tax=Rhizoctonia solani TaxID=456999 RepID=A0A8H3D9P9_9AGAM|nr:unnamed protein product [Rhizoctonia solani]